LGLNVASKDVTKESPSGKNILIPSILNTLSEHSVPLKMVNILKVWVGFNVYIHIFKFL
jgi:hypothetical protein